MSLLTKILIGLGLAGALWAGWLYHDHVEQKDGEAKVIKADAAGAAKQKVIDDAKLSAAESAHAKELEDIKNAYLAPVPVGPRVVFRNPSTSNNVPAPNVCPGPGTPSALVPTDAQLYTDQSTALELLSRRADTLAADARELNNETH